MTMKPVQVCSICGKPFTGRGHNAQPVNNGRCCDQCNAERVIPAQHIAAAEKKAECEDDGGG